MTTKHLTPAVLALFRELWDDRDNWSGTPLFSGGAKERGYLTHLKQAGLVTTIVDDDSGRTDFSGRRLPAYVFVSFTEAGAALASKPHACACEMPCVVRLGTCDYCRGTVGAA